MKEGELSPCLLQSPNCINSMYPEDTTHYMEAWRYEVDRDRARNMIEEKLRGMNKVKVTKSEEDYLQAEFTVPFFGFVDDVEFYFSSEASKIHFRSASRKSHLNLGVNKRRIKTL